ncbi:hypothetical protein [Mumia sp. DW29H23]|uniref:hypothetical protein n=1 Tax=Mumia sp. DW29H23 TaxID=3421241 RepID=UPI003D69763A
MPKQRRTTWEYRQWSLLVEARPPRPLGQQLYLLGIVGVVGALGLLYVVAGAGALIEYGPDAQTGGKYGPRSAWITLGGGIGFFALVATFLVIFLRKPPADRAVMRLRADGLTVLTSGRRATRPAAEVTVSWDDVVDVALEEVDGRERVAVRAVVDGAERTLLVVDLVEARTAAAVAQHFLHHPADRAAIGRRRGERRVLAVVDALQSDAQQDDALQSDAQQDGPVTPASAPPPPA